MIGQCKKTTTMKKYEKIDLGHNSKTIGRNLIGRTVSFKDKTFFGLFERNR